MKTSILLDVYKRQIHYLSPEMAPLFSYFVAQSYNGSYSGWTSRITNRLGNDVKDQIIYTETFESGQANRISRCV